MNPTKPNIKIVLTTLMLTVFTAFSNASVTISPTGNTNEYAVNFTPFVLTTQGGNDLDWLIFEDFYTFNSTADGVGSGSINLTINGITTSHGFNNASGTFNSTIGALDPSDLLLNITQSGPNNLTANTEITVAINPLDPPTFVSTDVPDFNPTTTVSFYQSGGTLQATNSVTLSTVPEPSSALLIILGLSVLFFRRRR